MSHPPPGLGGGAARAGPPPGFGAGAHSGAQGGASRGGAQSTDAISRAQIVFLLTTFTEDTFDKVSAEIRTLASSNGPETYHHFVRRTAVVAAPIIQILLQHSQQYKDDLAAPPPQLPTVGPASLAWRLLLSEAVRAARDSSLAPHFVSTILSPSPNTPLPLPSFRPLAQSPSVLFALSAFALAAPHVFPPTHPAYDHVVQTLQSTFAPTVEVLAKGTAPFWASQHSPPDDLTMQEARALILAAYPQEAPTASRPATPTNPTAPHPCFLESRNRGFLLEALGAKFRSPAIVLQTLSALSPGGPPRSPNAIPLEDFLFELGNRLTTHDTVEAAIASWWGPYILNDPAALQAEVTRFIAGLLEGVINGRLVNAQGVFEGLSAAAPTPFADVIKLFDQPQSPLANLPVAGALAVLLALLQIPPQSPVPPIAGLLPASPSEPVWSNLKPLLYIITNLISLPPDRLPLFIHPSSPSPSAFARVVDPIPSDAPGSKTVRSQAAEVQAGGLWNALGLYQVIITALAMAEAESALSKQDRLEIGSLASDMLGRASQLTPELLLVALEKLPKPLPPAAAAKHVQLLRMFFASPPAISSYQLMAHQLYQIRGEAFIVMLLDLYNEDENHISRIVEIAGDLKILDKLLASENVHFALDTAAVASNNQMLNLENWLADGVAVRGNDFLQIMFEFCEHKATLETEHQGPVPLPAPLGENVYSIFIRVIRNAESLDQEDIARFKTLRTDILILHPRLLNFRPNSKEEQGFAVAQFPKDVEGLVDEMYQHMYDEEHPISLDHVINELKRCQASSDPRDHDIFACALHSLFDEIRFIKTYPPRELTMTGVLFGALIDYRLVKDVPAFVATRYVLDAIKSAPQEPTYQFGIAALSVLRSSLVDFPGLCRSLLEISALHESHPSYIADIQAALAEREEIALQGGVKLAFPALRLPILIEEGDDEFKEPEPKLRDQIMFTVNQIAPSNFETKSVDLVKMFEDQYSRWFAHYLIDVRVASELNRHDEYYKIVELINSPVLERHILWETYRKARDLLNAETALSRANERQTLKTVAIWLGRITLARNIPLKHRELSIKDLLIQGHDNKRLIVAIPFVCNILVACKQSDVFHLPNPWLRAILRVLAELYSFGELRLNLKFEIEVLFRELGTQVELIEPSTIIREHVPAPSPQSPLPNRLDLELQRVLNTGSNFGQEPFAINSEQAAQAAHEQYNRHVDELIAQLPEFLVFNSDYGVIQAPTFKRMVHIAIDRAIKEIIQPVVERSVTIAGISTRDLVQKDFGTESDPAKMRHAAHLMVQNLAGNLSLVTCREPLRTSMMQHLRALVSQNGFTEENVPDAVLAGVVNENLDVSSDIIKKAAMERAMNDIDVNLQQQFAARRTYRDSRSQQPFWDAGAFSLSVHHNALPDPLRIRPTGLTAAQLRVYEDFAETARQLAAPILPQQQLAAPVNGDYREAFIDGAVGAGMGGELKRGPSPRYPLEMAEASPPMVQQQTSLERFHELVAEVEKHLAHAPAASLAGVPADHEIRALLRGIFSVATTAMSRESTTLIIAQKVVQLLFKSTTPLGREVYVSLLHQLCLLVPKVGNEVRSWLIYAEDPRKFNVPVTVALMQSGMIRASDLDPQISKLVLRGFNPQILDFAAQLIRDCTLTDQPCAPRNGFAATVAALLRAQEAGQSLPVVDDLLDDLRGSRGAASPEPKQTMIDTKVTERLEHHFLEWVRLFASSKNPESAFVPYVTFLQKEGILTGDDISSAFYRIAISSAVEYDTAKLMVDGPVKWHGTDSLAKLVVLMVKNYGDKSGAANNVYYFKKIITIMSYALVQRHTELADAFEQRPWARFFTSLLAELQGLEQNLPDVYLGCLKALANVLGITQPTYAPRFAFAWLSIVSHRSFMAKLLQAPREAGWTDFHRCLMWLLRFLFSFLKVDDEEPVLAASSRSLYTATLRLLLVLMHDFPDYLVEFYHPISTAIPPHCIQLRNIVLAAFPQLDGPLPDPYRRLETLVGDMQNVPAVRSDLFHALATGNVRQAIDQFIHTGQPSGQAIVAELKNRIAVKTMAPDGTTAIVYNHTLLHAVVYYLGTTAVQRRVRERGVAEFDAKAPEVGILANLAFALDPEGQYYMLSVVADQLRFPSAHTLFFIYLMLYLFSAGVVSSAEDGTGVGAALESGGSGNNTSCLPERVGRVLLERVIVQRPHPWGLLVCFIELLENPTYGFWQQPFVRAENELYMLFVKARSSF
ncbi:CCR4-NOT core subunit cdc39 [Cryptotrichosporon argae]